MKKLIAVTAFILIFSISCSLFIFAAETPPVLLQISDASVYAGSSARVKVQIKNTGNMKECIFALEYDKEQLEYVKFIKSGQNISIADDEQEGLVTFTVKQGGTFAKAVNFTLEFKLKETLSSLANSLKISLKSVTDGNNAPVGATATSGGIILKQGDINGDSRLTSTDARYALLAAAGIVKLNAIQRQSADISLNGEINLADAREILLASLDRDYELGDFIMTEKSFDYFYQIISNDAVSFNLYSADSSVYAQSVAPGDKLGFRFMATAPFDEISVTCPSWGHSDSGLRLNLYKWSGNYTETISGKEISGKYFKDYQDNGKLTLSFENTERGEYLILVSDTTNNAGIYCASSDNSGGCLYKDGSSSDGVFNASIHYTKTPSEPYGQVAVGADTVAAVTALPEQPMPDGTEEYIVRDAMPDTWVATDGLSRTLPVNEDTGDLRNDKFVGLFYWDWHADLATWQTATYDNSVIISEAEAQGVKPSWEGTSGNHFWGKPIWGYYKTNDDWVLRKQAELLAAAGVDVIIFDNTNATHTWKTSYMRIFEVFAKAREDGVKTPQISFILPFSASEDSRTQLYSLYNNIYREGKYQDLWFYWKGKPLIMAYRESLNTNLSIEDKFIKDFFTFRAPQPSYVTGQGYNGDNMWGWLSIYPQQIYNNADGTPEQITVGVAQNYSNNSANPGLTAMNGIDVFGRTYTSEGYDTRENALLYGANFEEQFEYALKVDPEFIFITGWNEWVATKFETWQNVSTAFPDQYNPEYSRDIEPSDGILKDHYYYQMVSYIRKFKGVRKVPNATEQKTIDINSGSDMWADVGPNYIAYKGNTFERNHDGWPGNYYKNNTGRNDIIGAKVAHDSEYVYFMVETADDLTPQTDSAWMRLFIDVSGSSENWETFEYIVNRSSPGDKALLERSKGGWNWQTVGEIDYNVSGRRLQLKIPQSMLGLNGDTFTINFKWSDNMQTDGDIMDFYNNGDVAPLGRFKYQYNVN